MPIEETTIRSALSVAEIAKIFQIALDGRTVEFGKIKNDDDPFATVETQPDFSATASQKRITGGWAVQLYVYDEGSSRLAEIHAGYDSGLSRAINGIQHTYSKSASTKKAQALIAALREVDSSLVIV